jgi:hypothetical protein
MNGIPASNPLTRVIHILLLTSLVMIGGQTNEWQINSVDEGTGGRFSSLRIDKYGNAHVAYFDGSQGNVQYGFWDRNLRKWFTTTVGRTTGYCSLALDSQQRPHISYPEYGSGKLRHTYFDGSAWQSQLIPIEALVINYYTSIALDKNGYPTISFYEELGVGDTQLRLRVVNWNGHFWELRTVDSDHGSGKFNSIAIDSAGNPQIAYGNVEYKNASLRYARWNGHSWDLEILEGSGQPGTSMWSVALVLDKKDVPHIAYSDVRNSMIKYATKVDGQWQLQQVDPIGKVGYPDRNGIALDENGNPYISYYDAGRGVLKVAHKTGQKWITEIIDQGFAGFQTSLQIHDSGIWVTYSNDTGDTLRVARRSLEPAAAHGARESLKKAEVQRK